MAKTTSLVPVAPGERILALDVLRGFAMLGVLIAYCMWSLGTAPEARWSALDRAIGQAVTFAVDGKFYTILAFLFGLGFSIQLGRARDDSRATRTFARRLGALAAIGLIHALLLRNGDILLPYAICGFLLIPLRRSSGWVLFAAASVALLVPEIARLLWEASGIEMPDRPSLANEHYLVENFAWVRYWYATAIFNWPANVTLFLFGYHAGRTGLLTKLQREPRILRLILGCGFALGTTLYAVWLRLVQMAPSSELQPAAAELLFDFHCWSMSSAYMAALLLALKSGRGQSLLSPLAAVGRLALTNYLAQAALLVPLCLALSLFNTFTPTTSLSLAVAIFMLVQLPVSLWWLGRFQIGPVEWVWRLLTYGYAPPLKLADQAAA